MGRAARGNHRAPTRTRWVASAVALVALAVVLGVGFTAAVLHRPSRAFADGSDWSAPPSTAATLAETRAARPSIDRATRAAPRLALPTTPRFPSHAPVLLVGDSLAVGIADALTAAWPDRALTVEAEEGRSASTSVALLADHAAATGPVWVVSLGTNDAAEEFPAAARAMVRLAGPSRCVLWFDVHRPDLQEPVDAELARLARRHDNVHVLGWQALADAHPEWFGWDGIHPDTPGYAARAAMAVDAVAQLCTTG